MSDDHSKELVTDENFNEYAYLAANPDVAAARVSPRLHFNLCGRAEGRSQFKNLPKNRGKKFLRFKHVLKSPFDKDPTETFPIITSEQHFDIGDYVNESANPGYGGFDHELATNPEKLYLDIGCGFREKMFDNCLYLEVYPSRSADLIVAPDCTYPIRDGVLDGIGCFAVLEHTRKPWLVIQEMHRMLKPGGRVWIDLPFLQPVHGYPSHFFNATREGLTSVFQDSGFRIDSAETLINQTPAYTIWWILAVMALRIEDAELRTEFEEMTVKELIALDQQSPTWWKFLNAISPSAMSELAAGNFLIATKT
ncbi:methyltransferase domain-containing protein [Methylobacterium radiotolerans]|uniref:methyltransferase domain-containing protein n=1 Tax=Methylobacterium TaxID=407 RepID=UPI0005E87B56|nr:methyltransferase domain-containing protein [Methylobacterium radiotolerans]MBN6822513.1 methyltransferase domain-containing protein [Methylobacterium organophilum]GAN47805.1 methyltransferase type 11 [Methylobacterium sp. ME121]